MDLDRLNELEFEKSSKWRTIVLVVTLSLWWKLVIVVQCYVGFFICTYSLAFSNTQRLDIIRAIFDVFYVVDVVCTISYILKPKLQKLRYVKVRGWFWIFVDIVSMIPLELTYDVHNQVNDHRENMTLLFMQNRCLRMYRLFLLESMFEIKVRKGNQYAFLFVVQFMSKAFLISHILCCIWVNLEKSVECDSKKVNCFMWYESNIATLLILNWSGSIKMLHSDWEHIIVVLCLFFGFLLIYAYFYPYVLYISMILNQKRALYYDTYGKLQCFLHNMIHNELLKKKIMQYFNDIWKTDREDSNMDILMKNIPLALKKEIFTDIYWEAFRHSEIFRDVSRNCKRSLSLKIVTMYFNAGDVIYRKGQSKQKMIYLVRGIIQIMAEENDKSPVMSFSSGTVFGEMPLFIHCTSQAILMCKSQCEVHSLKVRDVAQVIRDYPKDKAIVFANFSRRMKLARFAQWRKQRFRKEQQNDVLGVETANTMEDCIKWLKGQWKAVWEVHHRHKQIIKAKEEGTRLPTFRRISFPEVKIEFISNFLDLFVLSDVFEEKEDVVCLSTKFPWSIDPDANFVHVWGFITLLGVFYACLVYPFCTAWLSSFPWPIYISSFIVTLIFQVDFFLKLFSAVKTKNRIVTNFSSVMRVKLQQPTFYLDFIASIPYQLYFMVQGNAVETNRLRVGLMLHLSLVKGYLFVTMKKPLKENMERLTVYKNCFILFLLMYWLAEALQLVGVRNIFGEDHDDWIQRFIEDRVDKDMLRNYYVAVLLSLGTAVGVPEFRMYADNDAMVICLVIAKFCFFFVLCFFFGDFFGVHIVKIYSQETFNVLLGRIQELVDSVYIPIKVSKRLVQTVKFQWKYDHADYLSSKVSILKSLPFSIRHEIYKESTFKIIQSSLMFEDEPLDFAIDFLEGCFLVAVPAGSTLVTFGHMSHMISLIHRGYCQINSFLAQDNQAGVGFPIVIGPGAIFPLMSSFSNTPSPVTVLTITDCEVLMINLDDFLNILIKYDMFKDVVDVINEGEVAEKMKNIKPGLIRFVHDDQNEQERKRIHKESFHRYGWCGFILRLLYRRDKVLKLTYVHLWVAIYSIYFIILSVLWPCCFGLLVLVSHFIIPVLCIGNIIFIVHIVLQIHSPYYDRNGIKVTHPVFTFWYYMKTNFLLDFICIFPIYPIYWYTLADPQKKPDSIMVCLNCAQNYLKVLHIVRYMDALDRFFTRYTIRMFKIFIVTFVTINLQVNLAIFLCSEWGFSGPHVVNKIIIPDMYKAKNQKFMDGSLAKCYIFATYLVIANLTNTNFFIFHKSTVLVVASYIQSVIGSLVTYYLFAWISSTSLFANIRGTIYQEKIASFVKHLEFENANDKLIEFAIAHYNNEWSRTHGESLREIFEHLPVHLHEELLYPQYRPTIIRNSILAKANEGFYKILATHMSPVYFTRGSVIIFQNEVQSDMYFLHRGQCFVYDWFLTLDAGSIIGDIKQTGLMENKIYALTHVEMLKISSREFYMIVNNFDDLEAEFLYTVRNEENFLRSDTRRLTYEMHLVDSKDVLNAFGLQMKSISFEDQSYFEDPENTSLQILRKWKYKPEERRRNVIYPGTWAMKTFTAVSHTVRWLTFFVIPALLWYGTLSLVSYIVVGALDACWLLIIIINFRVSYVNQIKGDVVTNSRLIAKAYLRRWNGFFLDLIALIPFEMIPIGVSQSFTKVDPVLVGCCRFFRLLRSVNLIIELQKESKKLNINSFMKWWTILTFIVLWLYVIVNVFIAVSYHEAVRTRKNPYTLYSDQAFSFAVALQNVIVLVAIANIAVLLPSEVPELWFLMGLSFIAIYFKGWIISKVLSIFYVKGLATSYYKSNVKTLETYLVNKDTSPAIIKEVLNYKFNLLLFSRSENMPVFLSRAPLSLRMAIMKDLYIQHLQQCPLFIHTPAIFLEQLVARMTREVYFPGMKVVEQFDVDHRMYFIHKGEVYVINQTRERAYIEMVVGMLVAGMYFGESQGLWFSRPHAFTYRARTVVEILVLRSKDWMDLRRIFPQIAMDIFREAKSLRII